VFFYRDIFRLQDFYYMGTQALPEMAPKNEWPVGIDEIERHDVTVADIGLFTNV